MGAQTNWPTITSANAQEVLKPYHVTQVMGFQQAENSS